MSDSENNLDKLGEFLENDLAKRLLKAFKESGDSSVRTVLFQELTESVELKRVVNDKTENN